MTDYNAGSARATWELDLDPLRRGVAEGKRLYGELQRAAQQAQLPRGSQTVVPRSEAPLARPVGGGPGRDPAAQAQRAAASTLQLARAEAQLLVVQGNRDAAVQRLSAALAQQEARTIGVIRAQTQLERLSAPSTSGLDRLRGSVQGVTAALGAMGVGLGVLGTAQATIRSFADAFKFKAELDGAKDSINVLLRGVRDSNQVWADGAAYAERYKLTQQELTDALNASTILMRSTTAPTEQLLGVMQRLTVLNPAENIQGAAFALKELAAGDITSIAERFNVSRQSANAMKAEILAGGDAVKILDKYLQGIGVTSDALSAKLDGPIGKMKDLAIAQEELRLAQADWAAGPGLVILQGQIDVTRGATRLLSGDWDAMSQSLQESNRQLAASMQDVASAMTGLGELGGGGGNWDTTTRSIEENAAAIALQAAAASLAAQKNRDSAAASEEDAISKARQRAAADLASAQQAQLDAALQHAASSSDIAGVAASKLADIYGREQYPALVAIISLLRQKAALEGGPVGGAVADVTSGAASGARRAAEEAAKERAEALAAAQQRYTEATENSAQRVARLRAELARLTPGTAAYVDAQTALYQAEQRLSAERQRGATTAARAAARQDTAAQREREREIEQARRVQERIEEQTRQHYESLRRMQEDYALSSSRRQEDYELERQRLLAEGRIKEAQLLEQRFALEQRRAAEDAAIARRREVEAAQQEIARARAETAGISPAIAAAAGGGVARGGSATTGAAGAAQAAAILSATAAQRPASLQLQVQIAPTSVQIGPEQIVTVTWPLISERIDAALTGEILQVALTAPPATAAGGVGGPTP